MIVDIVSIVLSALALGGAVFTYIVHDRKLKRQEALLNAYQIADVEARLEEKKKAFVRGTIIKGRNGNYDFRVFNSGSAEARNVKIEFLEGADDLSWFPPGPETITLLSNHNPFQYHFLDMGNSALVKVRFSWENDFSKENEFVEDLQLV